ncbi:hypothetical protein B0A55_10979 [Friedmanniomyces simplex]|uniref:Uncharacterized protein n=1 Tax=Friedmanniomyces simplex TaxID=329884 RepID=A0A4U0WRH9_9PEZI|nr:hypothetical protein B0A55_10979 [Friedmanniomyces simplex]
MSSPYAAPLSRAESHRAIATNQSAASRNALADAQNRKNAVDSQLQTLRKQHGGLEYHPRYSRQWHNLLCRRLEADMFASQLASEVQAASELLVIREKEFKQALSDEAEMRVCHDACLFGQGKLKSIESENGGASGSPWQEWRGRVDIAFADYAGMSTSDFPAPPPLRPEGTHTLTCPDRTPARATHAHVCTNPRRHPSTSASRVKQGRRERPIVACECAVRAAFRGGGDVNLRTERLRWAPEKFPVELRGKATYVCGIVQGMYEAARQP